MGVVTASSSAARSPLGLSERFSSHQSQLKRPLILAFKTDKTSNDLATSHEPIRLPIDTPKEKKRIRRSKKTLRRVNAVSTDEATSCTTDVNYNEDTACTTDVNYNEAAAKLENIFNLSAQADVSDLENIGHAVRRRRQTRKEVGDVNFLDDNETSYNVVRNHKSKFKRLSLSSRIALRRKEEMEIALTQASGDYNVEKKDIKALVRGYSVSTFHISMDWKKMKIAPVLPSSEHTWLFELMQPMKALLQVKDLMHKDFGREPTHDELAAAMNVTSRQVKRHIEVGRAARNKLIKHNLRLVLFTINKYFQEYANGSRFNDLCQAGAEGLITAIDRFEPKRRSKLSTYGLFWIRHSIMRSMTLSSFTKVPFGLESVRIEIQKIKSKLTSELQRVPTEEEVIEKIGISRQRYNDVLRASQRIFSLHARHPVTQEEFINGVTDVDGGTDKRRQPALLRLAVDDVLDSLKPKENLVIRQRFGLDGKGDRTLGEIAGNLNISREMVRKHELKALMKLKHPTRVDYLRRYIF